MHGEFDALRATLAELVQRQIKPAAEDGKKNHQHDVRDRRHEVGAEFFAQQAPRLEQPYEQGDRYCQGKQPSHAQRGERDNLLHIHAPGEW